FLVLTGASLDPRVVALNQLDLYRIGSRPVQVGDRKLKHVLSGFVRRKFHRYPIRRRNFRIRAFRLLDQFPFVRHWLACRIDKLTEFITDSCSSPATASNGFLGCSGLSSHAENNPDKSSIMSPTNFTCLTFFIGLVFKNFELFTRWKNWIGGCSLSQKNICSLA